MVDDKQFYISQYKSICYPNWNEIPLLCGQTLHYQSKLNIVYKSVRIVLIGYAWQVDPQRKDPHIELSLLEKKEHISHNDVYEIEKSWCGRYLLIVENWIFLDTIGSLGIFYSDSTISSSLNVLCSIEKRDFCIPPIEHQRMPDFIPGMQTPYANVRRLLPSQTLNIVEKRWQIRPLLIDEIKPYANYDEGIILFSKYFVHSLKNLNNCFPNYVIWLALTGGRDSRAALSLLEKAELEYKTCTLWHENIKKEDYKIAKKIALTVRKKHLFVKRNSKKFSLEKYKEYQKHTFGMAVDEDWQFYAYQQYQQLLVDKKPIVLLRSSIWEIANEYYTMVYREHAHDLSIVYPYIKKNKLLYDSIKEWREYVSKDDQNQTLSLSNRMLWELRSGCWLSSIEQSFDIMENIVSLQPANCRLLLSLLLAFPYSDRLKKNHENKIVSYLCPMLSSIPYDYQTDSSLKTKIKRLFWKLIQSSSGLFKK